MPPLPFSSTPGLVRPLAVWALAAILAWSAPGLCAPAEAPQGLAGSGLSKVEMRWLRGAWPVITAARQSGMALDLVVQPQPTPGAAPLALAFVGGRCKMVLSMRGNPAAEATLAAIAPELLDVSLELMAAHELGHCRRYLDGAWHGLPAGFAAAPVAGLPPALRAEVEEMAAERREEGYGDLVGLAWTRQQHPDIYPELQAWLLAERLRDRVAGSPHDTRAWVELAGSGSALATGSIFGAAAALWSAGLSRKPIADSH